MAISNSIGSLINQSFGAQSAPQPTPDPAKRALKQAETRSEQQTGSTQVQLSTQGRIKGAIAEAQAAGKAVAEVRKDAPREDVKKAATRFVEAFNRAQKATSSAAGGEGNTFGAAGEARAPLAGIDLRRSLQTGNTPEGLKSIGIDQNQDGSLKIDEQAFDQALQANPQQTVATLANAGQRVERTAARELSDVGNVGTPGNRPDSRARELEAQRTAQQEQATLAEQRAAEQRTARTNNNVAGGLAAYQRTFTG